jgi:hypothetical protein
MGESFVKKRFITSLAAGTLMAAMLPGMATAQTEGQVALTYALNFQCEFGQGSATPPREVDESVPSITIVVMNPQSLTGAFDGIAVLDGHWVGDQGAATFETTGTAFFAGEVEGCGVGTVIFDYTSAGTINEDGSNTSDHDTYTIVPGGTLAVTGGYTQTGEEIPNGDGTATIPYTATYSCDGA